jgi:hypothetical protein
MPATSQASSCEASAAGDIHTNLSGSPSGVTISSWPAPSAARPLAAQRLQPREQTGQLLDRLPVVGDRAVGVDAPRPGAARAQVVERPADRRFDGVGRAGGTERFDGDMIAKLCAFYGVGVGDLLEYDPNMQEASYTEGVLVPA